MDAKQEMTLKFKKSTKWTHVYEAEAQDLAIQSVYVAKHKLPSVPVPLRVKITLEVLS